MIEVFKLEKEINMGNIDQVLEIASIYNNEFIIIASIFNIITYISYTYSYHN